MSQSTAVITDNSPSVKEVETFAARLGVPYVDVLPDAWATKTTFDEYGPCIQHSRSLEPLAGFETHLTRLITDKPGAPEVTVRWGGEYDGEEFCLNVTNIPQLVEVLTVAHRTVTEAPRALHRNPDVTAELMERDA